MAPNSDELQWYGDQSIVYFGMVEALILLILIIKNENNDATKNPLSFKLLVYCVYIFSFGYFAALAASYVLLLILDSSVDQVCVCKSVWIAILSFAGLFAISLINLFLSRLRISFENTFLAISDCTHYIFAILFTLSMVVILIIVNISLKPDPYNVHTHKISYSGSGITCSSFMQTGSNMLIIGTVAYGLLLSFGNVAVWMLFINKLYKLLKAMHDNINASHKIVTSQNISKNDENQKIFIKLMQKHTMIVGIACFSTIISWILQSMAILGQMMGPLDICITIFVVFLSFNFNKMYFQVLQCDRLTICCCKYFENYIVRRVGGSNRDAYGENMKKQLSVSIMPQNINNGVKLETKHPKTSE